VREVEKYIVQFLKSYDYLIKFGVSVVCVLFVFSKAVEAQSTSSYSSELGVHTVVKFTANGTFNVPSNLFISAYDLLIVGGGGAGGGTSNCIKKAGGGGGGGQVRLFSRTNLSAGNYPVVVGSGGISGGVSGGNSSIFGIVSNGGRSGATTTSTDWAQRGASSANPWAGSGS